MDLAAEVDGCGLMNLRARAEAHSAYVEMSSKLGEGYRFKAVLKLTASNQS
jgi:signal transduction histidine kinase